MIKGAEFSAIVIAVARLRGRPQGRGISSARRFRSHVSRALVFPKGLPRRNVARGRFWSWTAIQRRMIRQPIKKKSPRQKPRSIRRRMTDLADVPKGFLGDRQRGMVHVGKRRA